MFFIGWLFMLPHIPTIKIDNVYHIGLLDNKKKIYHEGNGLAITSTPETWKSICFKLISSLYRYKTSPVEFVDVISIQNNLLLNNLIFKWCLNHNFIKKENVYIVSYEDKDLGLILTRTFTSIKELERNGFTEKDIIRTEFYNTTDKLNQLLYEGNTVPVGLLNDFIILAYILKNTSYKGAWWNDSINIKKYKAPRGVIFKEYLNIKNFKLVNKSY